MQNQQRKPVDPAAESEQVLPNSDQPSQLMDDKAEKYLRESGEIEDMPEDQDFDDYDNKMNEKMKRRPL